MTIHDQSMKIGPSLIAFLLFIVIIAVPPALLQYTGNTALITPGFWTLFIFMSVLTFLVLVLMLVVKKKNDTYFPQAFLGGTTFKILASLVFIFIFLSKNSPGRPVFLGDFAYVYLLNMGFEVYILLRNLRHENLR